MEIVERKEKRGTMKRRGLGLMLCGILVMLSTGCRKDLCYNHDAHRPGCKLQITTQWEREWERPYGVNWKEYWPFADTLPPYDEFRPGIPSGLEILCYDSVDENRTDVGEYHLPAVGGLLFTERNTRALLFFNDDTEYIIFNDIDSAITASATTRSRSRSTYTKTHKNERTVNPPDMLYGHYIGSYRPVLSTETVQREIVMRPLVFTYVIRFHVDSGLQYVALARGALSGMAEKVYLQEGRTGEEAVTVLFDCQLTDYGAEARVMSFGVPGFPDRYYTIPEKTERSYGLNLEVMLNNGKMLEFDADITRQMEKQPRGGVIEISGIHIPATEGEEGGSGFSPSVDGWGDYRDIDIDL